MNFTTDELNTILNWYNELVSIGCPRIKNPDRRLAVKIGIAIDRAEAIGTIEHNGNSE